MSAEFHVFRKTDKEARVERFAVGFGITEGEARQMAGVDRTWERVFSLEGYPHYSLTIQTNANHKPGLDG